MVEVVVQSGGVAVVVDTVVGGLGGAGAHVGVAVIAVFCVDEAVLVEVIVQGRGVAVVVDAVVGGLGGAGVDVGVGVVAVVVAG